MSLEHLRIRADYLAARNRAKEQIAEEKLRVARKDTPWPTWSTSAYRYESFFRSVMHERFGDFFAGRRSLKGKVFAMDVMGAATFIRPAIPGAAPVKQIDGEVDMTLFDFRGDEEKAADKAKNRLVIANDAMSIMPWLDAQEFIDKNDDTAFPGFDLITCHPLGGWNVLRESRYSINPHHDFFEWVMVQRMFRLLSPNGGTMLVKMATQGNYAQWIRKLQETEGIHVEGERNLIRIVKESPNSILLPKITGVIRPVEGIS